jgi:hypothetical protein
MELAAWIASALVFMTFFMKTMLLLRVVAIASNVAFITYAIFGFDHGIFEKVLPILVLHLLLLPLNLLRIYEMKAPSRTEAGRGGRHEAASVHARRARRHPRGLKHRVLVASASLRSRPLFR